MKKIFTCLLVVGFMFGATSCSNKKVKNEESQAQEQVTESDLELDDSDFIVDGEEAPFEESTEELAAPVVEEVIAAEESVAPAVMGSEVYTVQKGETLMWIAFKLYGDYRKWKDIRDMNPNVNVHKLSAGTKLSYTQTEFMWNPKGLPHLIKSGETLGTISNERYGTHKKWKNIWENNKEMIRNPNLIFAGFTLYYIPEERELASEANL